MTTPILLVVAARSGSGKTTLLERLIPELAGHGVRVAVVKLTHHDVDPDPPGKDSRRLRDAGAAAAVLGGPHMTSLFVPRPLDIPELARLATSAGEVDLVVVEGGRDEPALPRIEVVPPGAAAISRRETLVGLATDGEHVDRVPCVARDDIQGLAKLVVSWLRAATSCGVD